MRKAVPKEGPRAPLFFSTASIAMLALLSSFAANSQSVDMTTLERCISLETEELKLRCFEAIVASSETNVVEESTAPESPVAASSPEQVTQPTDDAADDVVASGPAASAPATPEAEAASTVGPAVVTTGTAASAASAPAAPIAESVSAEVDAEADISTAAATAGEDAFGQEHLALPEHEQEKDETLLRATVIEVSKGRNDILYFSLDNGQVWRQIEARHFSYPKNSKFEVKFNRGMMGEYRMRIGDNGRMVRVRRVK